MSLQKLKNKIHQFSNSSDFQNAFDQLKADIREAVNIEEPGDHKPYYTNHVARELFQKAADFGLNHLIEGEVDAGFRPVAGDTTFLTSGVTTLATPTLGVSTDSETMQVTLTSTTVTDASTYQFQFSTSSDFSSPTNIQNTSSTTATYTVTSAGTFYFRLRACGADSSQSNWTATQNVSSEAWTPSSMTTSAWYDVSDGNTLTIESSVVTKINDKSGNDIHLNAANHQGTNTHTLTSNALNGLSVVALDGDDRYNPSVNISVPDGNLQTFVLAQVDEVDSANDSIIAMAGNAPNWQLQASSATDFKASLNSQAGVTSGSSTNFEGGYHIFNAFFDWGNTTMRSYVDGTVEGSATPTGKLGGPFALRVFTNRGNAEMPKGKLAEIVICLDVSDTVREKIEGYLAHKWGLESNLPTDHTYKSSAPIQFTS